MSSRAKQQLVRAFCGRLESSNLGILTIWLLLILLLWPPLGWAQLRSFPHSSGTISGTVLLAEGNRPAGGVEVQVRPFAGGLSTTTLTDGFGRFQVEGLRSGTYIVAVEIQGFEPIEETVRLADSSLDLSLGLKRVYGSGTSQVGSTVSVRELKIPAKAYQAFGKGLERLEKKDPAGSLTHFAQAAAAFPSYYEAYYQIGLANMELGRKEEAAHALQTAIDLSGGHYAPAQFALGVLFCQRGEFAEAERTIRKGLELSGASWMGHYYLAFAVYSQNRLEEAEKSAREAILRKPDSPLSHLLLAEIYRRKHDYRSLLEELHTYLKLEPHGPMSDQARQMSEAAQEALYESAKVRESIPIE
jgi:tetratricopeptide (TPR) repeat protein